MVSMSRRAFARKDKRNHNLARGHFSAPSTLRRRAFRLRFRSCVFLLYQLQHDAALSCGAPSRLPRRKFHRASCAQFPPFRQPLRHAFRFLPSFAGRAQSYFAPSRHSARKWKLRPARLCSLWVFSRISFPSRICTCIPSRNYFHREARCHPCNCGSLRRFAYSRACDVAKRTLGFSRISA